MTLFFTVFDCLRVKALRFLNHLTARTTPEILLSKKTVLRTFIIVNLMASWHYSEPKGRNKSLRLLSLSLYLSHSLYLSLFFFLHSLPLQTGTGRPEQNGFSFGRLVPRGALLSRFFIFVRSETIAERQRGKAQEREKKIRKITPG